LLLAQDSKEFHTVDIDMNCAKLTRAELKKHNLWSKANVYCGDGIKFLQEFDKSINLLYLDAWDVEFPNHAEMHLEAFKVAESKLANNAIVLIDDTDIGYSIEKGYHNDEGCLGGKGRLLIPFLLEKKNFKMLFKGRQTCFIAQT
jgi:spermidine synthase